MNCNLFETWSPAFMHSKNLSIPSLFLQKHDGHLDCLIAKEISHAGQIQTLSLNFLLNIDNSVVNPCSSVTHHHPLVVI